VPRSLREWAYAGFTFDVIGAVISILASGDPPSHVAIPLYALAMLLLSSFAWRRRERAASPSLAVAQTPRPA